MDSQNDGFSPEPVQPGDAFNQVLELPIVGNIVKTPEEEENYEMVAGMYPGIHVKAAREIDEKVIEFLRLINDPYRRCVGFSQRVSDEEIYRIAMCIVKLCHFYMKYHADHPVPVNMIQMMKAFADAVPLLKK